MLELIKEVQRILGLKYTDTVAELKMGYYGECLKSFIGSDDFKNLSASKKAFLAFDILRKISFLLKFCIKPHTCMAK